MTSGVDLPCDQCLLFPLVFDDKDVLATDDVISDADELAFSPVNVSQSSVSLKNVDARYG